MNIGVFDSGLGGLWILKYLREELPAYNYVFFGDQAYVPYGTKSKEELFMYATRVLSYLYTEKNCICVLLACNTTSSSIFEILQEWVHTEYPDRKIISIVAPTFSRMPPLESCAVFATVRTVESHVYKNTINTEVALPELCSRIESGGETKEYIASFASRIPRATTIGVLCCTHYGIVREDFIQAFPQITTWISQEEIIPEFFKNYLETHTALEKTLSKNNNLDVYVSKETSVFDVWLKKWYSEKAKSIHVQLYIF